MDTFSKFFIAGTVFVLTLAFGFWLSNVGKPYNGALFNIHKLLALGAVIAVIVQLTKALKTADSTAWIIALLIVAALCVLALFASGALMSAGKLDHATMLIIHRIASPVLIVSMALVIYLLRVKP